MIGYSDPSTSSGLALCSSSLTIKFGLACFRPGAKTTRLYNWANMHV